MRDDGPQFSVVIPLYNKAPFIRRAVESVLHQTLHSFEIIVVDDGSTDGSAAKLSDIVDPRLRVIRQENSGVSAARNTGMALAGGQWIAFLDGDDMWFSDHLEELARVADSFPNAGLISTTSMELLDGSEVSQPKEPATSIQRIDYFLRAAEKIGIINSTSAAIAARVFESLGGFKPYVMGEDLEYWARVALRYSVAISRRTTCIYFRNTNGATAQSAAKSSLRPVSTLKDLSPSVAMLSKARGEGNKAALSGSVTTYINSRVYSGIKGSLFSGDIPRARNISRLYLGTLKHNDRALRALLRLPSPAISALLDIYRGARKLARR